MPEYNVDELKQHVSENSDTQATGKTNLRLDASIVADVKKELGISRNSELSAFAESVIADAVDLEDVAEERLEAFKDQFTDED